MKKLLIYLGIIVIIFGGLFFMNQQSKQVMEKELAGNPYGKSGSELHPETVKQLSDPNYQNLIHPIILDKQISNKEDFFIYYYASTCPHCKRTTPVLNPIAQGAGADVKQLNLEEFPDAWQDYHIEYTPTLVYYKAGKEVERIVGGVPELGSNEGNTPEKYKAFFEKYNKK